MTHNLENSRPSEGPGGPEARQDVCERSHLHFFPWAEGGFLHLENVSISLHLVPLQLHYFLYPFFLFHYV